MDNPIDDRDKGNNPVEAPGELEEALKWLEELTARQGKPAELSNPVPPAALDSPFRGLIDNDEGDLPDWLKEVPTPTGNRTATEDEPESRLDWLAKMAQRESIEELPTLEWRRLPEPLQSAILTDTPAGNLPAVDIPETAGVESITVGPEETAVDVLVGSTPEINEELPASPPMESETLIATTVAVAVAETLSNMTDEPSVIDGERDLAVNDTDSLSGTDDAMPEVDDLDAAMAWIEELAVSQEAPIEDLPSVADRALASKLMVEAGLSPTFSPLDEFGSDPSLLDSLTPTHPFIEEEDFADTVVLVETLAADQRAEVSPDSELEPDINAGSESLGQITGFNDALPQPSFEDAMAYLDEMAQTEAVKSTGEFDNQSEQLSDVSVATVSAIEDEDLVGDEIDMPPADDFTPWVDQGVESLRNDADEILDQTEQDYLPDAAALNGYEPSGLEIALLDLDALALPPGRSLSEIDTTLQITHVAISRDVNTALDWLEAALSDQSTHENIPGLDLDQESIIDQMPEDPDAVLAWLEKLAGEEPEMPLDSPTDLPTYEQPTMAMTGAIRSAPMVEELAEADLLSMPDDPDEAMAWLESLARGSGQAAETVHEPVTAYLPDIPPSPDQTETISAIEPAVTDLQAEPLAEMVIEQIDETPVFGSLDAVTSETEIDAAGLPNYESPDMGAVEEVTESIKSLAAESLDVDTADLSVDSPILDQSEVAVVEIEAEPIELPAEAEARADIVEVATDSVVFGEEVIEIEETVPEAIVPESQVEEVPVRETPVKPAKTRSKPAKPKAIAETAAQEEVPPEPELSPPAATEETAELSWIDLLKPLQ